MLRYENHERILRYLYKRRGDLNYYDVLSKFKNLNKELIYESCEFLIDKKYAEDDPKEHTDYILVGSIERPFRKGVDREEKYFVRIKPLGIEYIQEITNRKQRSFWFYFSIGLALINLVGLIYFRVQDYKLSERVLKAETTIEQLRESSTNLDGLYSQVKNQVENLERETLKIKLSYDSLLNILKVDENKKGK